MNYSLLSKFCLSSLCVNDQEMALDFEIKRLYAVAASPELYPVMVQLGTVKKNYLSKNGS